MTKSIKEIVGRKTTHINGAFLIHAPGSFLNGAGLGSGEDKNTSTVKSFWQNGKKVPYVSSQAWRRWLRNTLIEETGWPKSEIEAIGWNNDGSTNKVAGQLDPITYPEDDIFGYMFASGRDVNPRDERIKRDHIPEEQLVRPSTFKSSLLRGIDGLISMNEDQGFVHLNDDTPLPYTTEFYAAELMALFSLEIYRLGVFEKKGNVSQELDPFLKERHSNLIEVLDHPVYRNGEIVKRKDGLTDYQTEVAGALIKSIARLNGGAKMAQFGTSLNPSLILVAGMTVGIVPFEHLIGNKDGKPVLNMQGLKELIKDYKDRFTTPFYIGMLSGYLGNEEEVRDLSEVEGVEVVVDTPIQVAEKLAAALN
ncbi:MAG: hypothetical protein D6732_16200 [Methanobacteriota archaeon]|nr:MAG: hypothetical protein D6732_16200 [Euryarchaeota archaeon]